MILYFDMDGTIADLYGVNNWLEYLLKSDVKPYKCAKGLNLRIVSRYMNMAICKGYKIGIITWLPKGAHMDYCEEVARAKIEWVRKHLKSVDIKAENFHILRYGSPKELKAQNSDILFDDEITNRENWERAHGLGTSFEPCEIVSVLKSLCESDI